MGEGCATRGPSPHRRRGARPSVKEGYESKVDAIISAVPRLRSLDEGQFARFGVDEPAIGTMIVAPSLADIAAAHRLAEDGRIADRPMFFVNVPSVLDESMRVDGNHVLSLETLYTPTAFAVVGRPRTNPNAGCSGSRPWSRVTSKARSCGGAR